MITAKKRYKLIDMREEIWGNDRGKKLIFGSNNSYSFFIKNRTYISTVRNIDTVLPYL